MSTVVPIGTSQARHLVATEVRAALARAKMNPTDVARLAGKSQSYWWRRIMAETTPFDVEDLASLALILHVPMTAFLPLDMPEGPGPGVNQTPGRTLPRQDSDLEPSDSRLWNVAA